MAEITYLMDRDTGGGNQFYTFAKGYFQARQSVVVDAPAGGQTLEEVFADLRARAGTGPAGIFSIINLVTHATGFSSLEFGLTKAERGHLLTAARLTNALAAAGTNTPILRRLGPPAVTAQTHVRLYGCDAGKDSAFLRNFGLMFGEPADVAAPLRLAVFRSSGGTVSYRLARSWAVSWPSDITRTPAANWPNVRTTFTNKADNKFGTVAAQRSPDPLAADTLRTTISNAANSATAATSGTFFFHEYLELTIPAGEPDPQAYVNRAATVSSAVITAAEVSDLTVESKVGPPDFTDRSDPGAWRAHLAVLAEVIDKPVGIDDNAQYRKVQIAPAAAPSPGPRPVGDGGAPPPAVAPPAHSLWQQASDAFLAAGGSQAELDELVTGLDDAVSDGALDEPEVVAMSADGDPVALLEGEAQA